MKHLLKYKLLACFSIAMAGTLLLSSCTKNSASEVTIPEPVIFTPGTGPDQLFYGLTDDNKLNRYNAKAPGTVEASVSLTGVPTGEKIISIDFRPANGQLYGLGSNSRLYTINISNGAVTPIGTAAFSPALNSQIASIDFNPTVDRIRLVTVAGQNLRLHPETGATAAVDGNINGGTNPGITSIAYTNSKAGATTTELYDIDISLRKLYKQNPPNDGTLTEVGNINANFIGKGGFDINPDNSVALASFTLSGKTRLHTINLGTGAATYINQIDANLIDLAIPTSAVAYAVDEANNLLIFDPTKPQTTIAKAITGLSAGEQVQGIDFRPANGQLFAFAVTTTGAAKLYALNCSSGAATAVGNAFTVTPASAYGFDFNPTVDRIRLVSTAGQNLRLNPNDGTIAAMDGNLNPGTPLIHAAAYTNNFSGATTTVLYVLDNSKLYRQDPPNNGTLMEIGNLTSMGEEASGFDIGGRSGLAYAILTNGTSNTLYSVNLNSGALTSVGTFSTRVRGFALGLGF